VSHLLELLGRGLDGEVGDLLDRYFWTPQRAGLDELRARCQAHPDRAELHFQLGVAYLRAVQLDEAQACLQQACRRQPDHLPARLALASAFEEQGRPKEALAQLKIANQTHPGEVPVLFAMGFCLEKLGRSAEAAEYYRDAIARNPSYDRPRQRLAAVATAAGNLDEAIAQYEYLAQSDLHPSWSYGALAHLHYRAGNYAEAVDRFEQAIAMEPENWSLVDDEVEALIGDGSLREAMERLHTLLEDQSDFADLHVRLADLYSQTGDDASASQHYCTALNLQPDYLEAWVKLGTHQLVCGRWAEAAEAFHRACELGERLLACYVGLAVAQMSDGRIADAMNSFELAGAVEPNSTILLAETARLQLKCAVAEEADRAAANDGGTAVADPDPARDDLLEAQLARHEAEVRRHGDWADLRYRYGVLLRAQGQLGPAQEQFAKAVEINPGYVRALLKLGITQQEIGHMDEAVETLTAALDVAPESVELHYRLGLLYTDRRRLDRAAEHMHLAVRHDEAGRTEDAARDPAALRAGLALALQNLGLMDRAAATWRDLARMQRAPT